jgi:hypothetical protein
VLQNQEVRRLFWAGRSNCGIVPLVLSWIYMKWQQSKKSKKPLSLFDWNEIM